MCSFVCLSKLFTPCHFPFTLLTTWHLQVLDFASLASGTKKVFISSASVQECAKGLSLDSQSSDIYHKTWYILLLYYSKHLCLMVAIFFLQTWFFWHKNMQRMHVNDVHFQNDMSYHSHYQIWFNMIESRLIETGKPASTTVILPLSTTALEGLNLIQSARS